MSSKQVEIYISVDIEASGPIPGEYSMLSLGACVVGKKDQTFYIELQPLNDNAIPEAISVSHLDLNFLRVEGQDPVAAMESFRAWLGSVCGDAVPVFVGFNATFDWSFINWYFHKFCGANPFGFGGVDIKSYYMALSGCTWNETKSSRLPGEFQPTQPPTHNALDDARAQGEMFEKMLRRRALI